MALDPDFGGMVIFYGPRREAKRLALGLHRACTQRHCLLQYHHAGSERAVRKPPGPVPRGGTCGLRAKSPGKPGFRPAKLSRPAQYAGFTGVAGLCPSGQLAPRFPVTTIYG